jgi:hypothetical protein
MSKQIMSKQSTSKQSTSKQSTNKSQFCKVCFDAGKDSAHPLRNATGQTVCAYLLSLNCNNCRKSGHTVKYCTSPPAKQASITQAPAKQASAKQSPAKQAPAKQASAKQATPAKQKTHFEAFQQLMAKEDKQEEVRECEELARRLQDIAHKKNFPEISKNVAPKRTSDSILTGWSKAVGKPVKVYETLSEEEEDEPVKEKLPTKQAQAQQAQAQQAQAEQQLKEQLKEQAEQQLKEQAEQAQAEPAQAQQAQAEQAEAEQAQAEQAQAEQAEAEQAQAQLKEQVKEQEEPTQSEYRPTYSSWADCE